MTILYHKQTERKSGAAVLKGKKAVPLLKMCKKGK